MHCLLREMCNLDLFNGHKKEGVSKQAHPLFFMRKAQTFASPGFVIS